MSGEGLNIVICGLTITSSWGNGHATTYRALVRELERRGHRVLFLERDKPWYAAARDLPTPPMGNTVLYSSLEQLRANFTDAVRTADAVIVGSYVPDGVQVGDWVLRTARGVAAFYDIDTPVTLGKLARGDYEYLRPEQIRGYDVYLSFTGGPTLRRLEQAFGSPAARALYCSVDTERYAPLPAEPRWDLGYLGTYSPDRQPPLEHLLIQPADYWTAGTFVVAGPGYPPDLRWPRNVSRIEHLPPGEHPLFYSSQRYTLNVTRAEMIAAGYAPSVRLFEAAACGTPILTDYWPGLETFFDLESEIRVVSGPHDVINLLKDFPDEQRSAWGRRARQRILSAHTAAHRAAELEQLLREARTTSVGPERIDRVGSAPHVPAPPGAAHMTGGA